jgi:energy-coupling factor transport system permease protein
VHALVKFVAVLCALLLINKYNFNFNLYLLFFILVISFLLKFSIPRLVLKLKFFLIITFLLYVFNTPGEYIVLWAYFSPSYEGLLLGTTQIMRLINSVALITMMVSFMSYQTLIDTFYLIVKPLRPLGIDAKIFAVRLCLTMEYVKTFQSLLLYSSNKTHRKHTYIEIKEERVNTLSMVIISTMVSITFFVISYI